MEVGMLTPGWFRNLVGNSVDETGLLLGEKVGLDRTVVVEITASVKQSYSFYARFDGTTGEHASGAYIFHPNGTYCIGTQEQTPIKVLNGPIYDEVHQKINPWIYQITRVFKNKEHAEVEFTISSFFFTFVLLFIMDILCFFRWLMMELGKRLFETIGDWDLEEKKLNEDKKETCAGSDNSSNLLPCPAASQSSCIQMSKSNHGLPESQGKGFPAQSESLLHNEGERSILAMWTSLVSLPPPPPIVLPNPQDRKLKGSKSLEPCCQ
uniref:Glycosyl hydrolase family 38 C-terminal domain-containing protein n=1 Tax=Lactuca sativa TaxID=4236 RepID=A0A9R1X3I9_LACSA|nr:hypothetical protein LSAT_V11C700384420 [Lactuca sativa]